jgi:formate dehydrogenase iron-sulfur subunit
MGVRLQIIQEHLKAQQDLSAVERFARLHDEGRAGQGPLYESQIPLTKPRAGQQYGFQVDLDACTGCKACVVGCNKMNGLDPDETWRAVGTIHGGTTHHPIQQTVTTACHHCLDPACMSGCPVGAYEKNPETGIVKHLDDQCIGCQYCTLTCPYEVPQYNKRLGIVRKCDMCQDRLAEGEAPACVESCPNGAIAIKIVDISEVLDDAQGDAFLPGAPSPGITGPTTTYKTQRNLPRNVLPANFYDVRPAAKHMPLVVMLVLTQLSVGAYVVDALLNAQGHSSVSSALGRAHSLIALGLGLLALGAATLHLGRPLYAFRAFIGLRTSWMSREIVAIGVFVKIAVIHALSFWKPELFTWVGIPRLLGTSMDRIQDWLSVITAAVGVLAAACSVMIYVATKRKWWSGSTTTLKFFGTAAVLGLSTMSATTSVTARITGSQDLGATFRVLLAWFVGISAAKLIYEAGMFRHLLDKQQGDLKRTALLMTRDLKEVTIWRFILGAIGGIILPGLVLLVESPPASTAAIAITCLSTLFMLGGELLERTLFFTAVSAPRMPGAIGK